MIESSRLWSLGDSRNHLKSTTSEKNSGAGENTSDDRRHGISPASPRIDNFVWNLKKYICIEYDKVSARRCKGVILATLVTYGTPCEWSRSQIDLPLRWNSPPSGWLAHCHRTWYGERPSMALITMLVKSVKFVVVDLPLMNPCWAGDKNGFTW